MSNMLHGSTFFCMAISLFGYEAGIFLRKKLKIGIFNPLLVSIVFVIIVLKVTGIDYDTYDKGANVLSYLLTPSTVCLAIPLYQQMNLLKKNLKAIIAGITTGVFVSLAGVWVFSMLFHLKKQFYVTLLPKSITTAIGMGISEELGGIVTITVAAIVITGIIGNMFAEGICKLCKIEHPIAKGLAIGTASHAMGTAKAMEIGEIEGAMSSLSIAVAGLMTVVGASIFYHLYERGVCRIWRTQLSVSDGNMEAADMKSVNCWQSVPVMRFTIKRSCLKLQRCADTRKKCRSIWMNSRWTAFFIQSQ